MSVVRRVVALRQKCQNSSSDATPARKGISRNAYSPEPSERTTSHSHQRNPGGTIW